MLAGMKKKALNEFLRSFSVAAKTARKLSIVLVNRSQHRRNLHEIRTRTDNAQYFILVCLHFRLRLGSHRIASKVRGNDETLETGNLYPKTWPPQRRISGLYRRWCLDKRLGLLKKLHDFTHSSVGRKRLFQELARIVAHALAKFRIIRKRQRCKP